MVNFERETLNIERREISMSLKIETNLLETLIFDMFGCALQSLNIFLDNSGPQVK